MRMMGCIALGLLLGLAGCDNDTDDSETSTSPAVEANSAEPATVEADEVEDDLAGIEPMAAPVEVALEAVLLADRRMQVVGRTNLPDGTRVQVEVVREASGVRWQERVVISAGELEAGPFGSGSGLSDGYYRLRLTTTPGELQPREVQGYLGSRGEHLSGPLIVESPHGLGQQVSAVQRVLVGQQIRRTTDSVTVEPLQ
ncbi:hypothetical protein [Halomonas cupida]|uniref:Lipoprotein n=1 Tax=Halomonas cupida TaxID=44933 RepID=A0A1M7MFZ2_9GAMM|nr:hypothetical protein [Halomonas cupida]GEN25793.1 hypothetical protein HCU01_37420 [Halomonas cupida]SHM89720.1 hypothetical protein SAMN05660971_04199 [Halomonas cupida]